MRSFLITPDILILIFKYKYTTNCGNILKKIAVIFELRTHLLTQVRILQVMLELLKVISSPTSIKFEDVFLTWY